MIWAAKGSAWSSRVSVLTCDPTWTGTASRQRSGKRRFSRRFTKLSLRCALVTARAATSIQKGETTAKAHAERPEDNVKKATNAIYAAIDRLGQVDGVPDKKALALPKMKDSA